MTYKAILAMDEKRGIGNSVTNSLPWPSIKEDFQFFKKTTLNANLICGRNTYESLPNKWLKNRTLWVLTRKNNYGWANATYKNDNAVVNIIENENELPDADFWVIGGKSIYDMFIPKCSEVLVSHIKGEYEGDIIMPEFESKFKNVELALSHEKFEVKRYFN